MTPTFNADDETVEAAVQRAVNTAKPILEDETVHDFMVRFARQAFAALSVEITIRRREAEQRR